MAGDGTILRGIPVEGSLPKIEAPAAPHGNRLTDAAALHAARVAGTAPLALRPRLELIEMRAQDGIVVQMRDGPELIFGDATRARAKWIAATRVLADPEAEGASYIDVRLPGRPAAGGLPAATLAPVAPAGTAGTTPDAAPTDTTGVDPATEPLAPATPNGDPATAEPNAPSTAGAAPPTAPQAPSRHPPPPIPPAPEVPRRPPAKSQPILELYTNPRAKLQPLPAKFLARAIDTSAELHLESGFCWRRETLHFCLSFGR